METCGSIGSISGADRSSTPLIVDSGLAVGAPPIAGSVGWVGDRADGRSED